MHTHMYILYLQVLFPVVGHLPRFDFSVLHIDLVATHHDGYAITDMLQVPVPYWDVVVSHPSRDIKHNDSTIGLDVVAVP